MEYQIKKLATFGKAKLLSILQDHKGRKSAIKKRELVRIIFGSDEAGNESYNNSSDRTMRDAIEELIQDGHPICSSASCGYWYADGLKDGLASVEENRSRALTQLANVKQLEDNIQAAYGGQLELM